MGKNNLINSVPYFDYGTGTCTDCSAKDAEDSTASFELTFVAIEKRLDLSDKISAGENIWGRF